MLSFALGVFGALFLLIAKYGIAKIILFKKDYIYWLSVIIFCELMVFVLPYIDIGVLNHKGEKFILGFLSGLVTSVLFYVISHVLKIEDDEG